MGIFELAEMAGLLGMPLPKAKNWTIRRPLKIEASIRTATGTGSRNLYSIEDVYLMGLAYEFSKAGMAAKAIGRLLEAIRTKLPQGLAKVGSLTVWRPVGRLSFQLSEGEAKPPRGVLVCQTVDVGGLVTRVNTEVDRLRRANKRRQ